MKNLAIAAFVLTGLLVASTASGVRAQEMPEHVQIALSRFVGKWTSESMVDGKPVQAEFDAEWTPDTSALTYRWKGPGLLNSKPASAFGTVGWDASGQVVRERAFASDGSTFEATHTIGIDSTTWVSPADGTFARAGGGFAKYTNKRILTWQGDDVWVVEIRDRKVDGKGEPDISNTWRRVKPAATQYIDFWSPQVGKWKSRTEVDGKPVEGTFEVALTANKSCYLSSESGGGNPEVNGLHGYDPMLRAGRIVNFNDAGGSSTLIIHVAELERMKHVQAGANGTYELYRLLPDGSTETETGHWSFPLWEANEHVLEVSNIKLNGQPQPTVRVRYERQ